MSGRWPLWVMLLGFAVTLGAQAPPNIAQGLGAAGAYQTGGPDTVNLMNGGLNLTIPLGGGAGQRGAVSALTVLVINSKGFVVSGSQWTGAAMSFQVVNPKRITVASAGGSPPCYVATTADGSTHILEGGVQVNGVSYPGYWAIDGSGIHYDSSADIATDRDGVRTMGASHGGTALEDPNGNEITLLAGGGYTDTLGRSGGQPVATGDLTGCTNGATSANNFTFPGANGNSYTYKLCYINLSSDVAVAIGRGEPVAAVVKGRVQGNVGAGAAGADHFSAGHRRGGTPARLAEQRARPVGRGPRVPCPWGLLRHRLRLQWRGRVDERDPGRADAHVFLQRTGRAPLRRQSGIGHNLLHL